MDLLSTRLATFPDCAELLGSNGVASTRALSDFAIPHVAPLLIRKPLMQVSLRSLKRKYEQAKTMRSGGESNSSVSSTETQLEFSWDSHIP